MVSNAVPITSVSPRVFRSRLENGSLVTSVEVPDDNFVVRYDVSLDGNQLGKLVLLKAPLTGENLWLATSDDSTWSPPVSTEREAARFLLPLEPVC